MGCHCLLCRVNKKALNEFVKEERKQKNICSDLLSLHYGLMVLVVFRTWRGKDHGTLEGAGPCQHREVLVRKREEQSG